MALKPRHSHDNVIEKVAEQWRTFGDKIRARRTDLGLTQVEVATRAGMERQQWNRIERGASTKRPTLLRIAYALELPDAEVLSWAGIITSAASVTLASGSLELSRLISMFLQLPAERQQDAIMHVEAIWKKHRKER
jgi:transcriptional regulator with XRE-family HTH domain